MTMAKLWFERLYRILTERVLRSLPKAESSDGKTESLTRGIVRDKVFGRFIELLSADRAAYVDKVDYFEVRFDGALASLRRDAQEQAWRDENRSQPLEYDEESGELSPEVEAAARDPRSLSPRRISTIRLTGRAWMRRLRLYRREQSRIIHMLRQGFPIDSKEPDVMTIAKALGRSEKTVRTYRDKAFAALRTAMADRRRAMSPAATRPSRESVLDAFAVESEPGRSTLERYLRLYPEYAGELIDLSRELSREVSQRCGTALCCRSGPHRCVPGRNTRRPCRRRRPTLSRR